MKPHFVYQCGKIAAKHEKTIKISQKESNKKIDKTTFLPDFVVVRALASSEQSRQAHTQISFLIIIDRLMG